MKYLCLLLLWPALLMASESTDPFGTDPVPPVVVDEPAYPEPVKCEEAPAPAPVPVPIPYPIEVEPVPPAYEWGCRYDLSIKAVVDYDDRYDAEGWCKTYGWDYCDVVRKGSKKYPSYQAVFSRSYEVLSEGYKAYDARSNVFTRIGVFVEENGYYKPVFTQSGSFESCWSK